MHFDHYLILHVSVTNETDSENVYIKDRLVFKWYNCVYAVELWTAYNLPLNSFKGARAQKIGLKVFISKYDLGKSLSKEM